jgi:hypothetical protein
MLQQYTSDQATVLNNLEISIRNIGGHDGIPRGAKLIAENQGSRQGCLQGLRSFHEYKSIHAWFSQQDIESLKRHAYIATKLFYIHSKEFEPRGMTRESEYFYALVSDHAPLIDWFMRLEPTSPDGLKMINNLDDHFYRHFQMTLALQGRWKDLTERAERFLRDIPVKMKLFAVDQRFYLALAQGNIEGMREALIELTSPKGAKARNKVEAQSFAFPCAFIGCYATMYAKIAWRHGYALELDTPLIPREWLPTRPLEKYEDLYPFMREYDTDSALPPPGNE